MTAAASSARRALLIAVVSAVLAAAVTAAAILLTQRLTRSPAPPQSAVTVAVVGDDYSAGRLNRVVWPTLLAQRTGWPVANFALPGAGYAADGPGGHAFTWQVDRALAARPRAVVLVGGIDDGRFLGSDAIRQGAVDALRKIVRAGKQALVIGPTWFGTPVPPEVSAISEEIRKAAEQMRVPFLDALDPPWLTPDQMLLDRSGPNDDGQSVIADKIAAWLRTEVPA